jgi:hypothetical protein
MGMVLNNTAVHHDYSDDHALYVELVEVPDINLVMTVYYDIYPQEDSSTLLNVNVNWMNSVLPGEVKQGLIESEITNLELFKAVSEKEPDYAQLSDAYEIS